MKGRVFPTDTRPSYQHLRTAFTLFHHHPFAARKIRHLFYHSLPATASIAYSGLGFFTFPKKRIFLKKRGKRVRHDSMNVYITGTSTKVRSIELVRPHI